MTISPRNNLSKLKISCGTRDFASRKQSPKLIVICFKIPFEYVFIQGNGFGQYKKRVMQNWSFFK